MLIKLCRAKEDEADADSACTDEGNPMPGGCELIEGDAGKTEDDCRNADSATHDDGWDEPLERHLQRSCHHNEGIVGEHREEHHYMEENCTLVV